VWWVVCFCGNVRGALVQMVHSLLVGLAQPNLSKGNVERICLSSSAIRLPSYHIKIDLNSPQQSVHLHYPSRIQQDTSLDCSTRLSDR
jgi:hypothetical protein